MKATVVSYTLVHCTGAETKAALMYDLFLHNNVLCAECGVELF